MKCPYCDYTPIDDDSWYCDQCGKEIFICPLPDCTIIGGKDEHCSSHGNGLISTQKKSFSSVQTNKETLHLLNYTIGLDISIDNEEIIGREEGKFKEILSRVKECQTISGRHLKVKKDILKGWIAEDLGSTNGTYYGSTLDNMPKIKPNEQFSLGHNNFLRLGTIIFNIQIKM